jgi:hypothetical protein
LLLGLGLYKDGFKDLNSERNSNGVIPWSAVQHYCKELEFSEEQTDAMHYHTVEMDECYQKWEEHKDKNKGKGK